MIINCAVKGCSYRKGSPFYFKVENYSNGIFFITENPSRQARSDFKFSGVEGELLKKEIIENNLPLDDSQILYCCWCQSNSGIKKQYKYCYKNNVNPVLKQINPKLLVVFGDISTELVLRKLKSFNNAGNVFWSDSYKCPVIIMPGVGWYLRNIKNKIAQRYWKIGWDVIRSIVAHGCADNLGKVITELDDLDQFFELDSKSAIIDTETDGLDFGKDILGVGFYLTNKKAYYIPLKHERKNPNEPLIDFWGNKQEFVIDRIYEFLQRINYKLAYNTQYDMVKFYELFKGKDLTGIWDDALLFIHCWHPKRGGREARNFIRFYPELSGYDIDLDRILKNNKKDYGAVPVKKIGQYCCGDVRLEGNLGRDFFKKLKNDDGKLRVYTKIYRNLVPIYSRAQFEGIPIDLDLLRTKGNSLKKRLDKIKNSFKDDYGGYEVSSGKQLSKLLFEDKDKFKLKPFEKGKNYYLTGDDVLKALRTYYKNEQEIVTLIDRIFDYRKVSKNYSTYIGDEKEKTGLWKHIDENGYIHPTAQLSGTVSGRDSYRDPNMQNIPARESDWNWIRNLFLVHPGFTWVSRDLSQAELRIGAFLSGDSEMIKIFKSGESIHKYVCHLIGVPEDVDPKKEAKYFEIYKLTKNLNFGLVYGGSDDGMFYYVSQKMALDMSKEEFYKIVRLLKSRFNTMFEFKQRKIRQIKKDNYIRLPYGFIRYSDGSPRMTEELYNTYIQGTCAFLMKHTISILCRNVSKRFSFFPYVFNVHDDIITKVPNSVDLEEYDNIFLESIDEAQKYLGMDFMESEREIYEKCWRV